MVGEEQISRGIEFQIAGVAQRREQRPKSILDGVGARKCWSEERSEGGVKHGTEGNL